MMEKRNVEESGRTICEGCKQPMDGSGRLCSKCSSQSKEASAGAEADEPRTFGSEVEKSSVEHNV